MVVASRAKERKSGLTSVREHPSAAIDTLGWENSVQRHRSSRAIIVVTERQPKDFRIVVIIKPYTALRIATQHGVAARPLRARDRWFFEVISWRARGG